MDQTLNTLERMIGISLEQDAAQPVLMRGQATQAAIDTTKAIVGQLTDTELVALLAELQIRKDWCAHIMQIEARSIIAAETKCIQAWRAGAQSAHKLLKRG